MTLPYGTFGVQRRICHNMLCIFCEKTKDFVKITFDKSGFTLYNI